MGFVVSGAFVFSYLGSMPVSFLTGCTLQLRNNLVGSPRDIGSSRVKTVIGQCLFGVSLLVEPRQSVL